MGKLFSRASLGSEARETKSSRIHNPSAFLTHTVQVKPELLDFLRTRANVEWG